LADNPLEALGEVIKREGTTPEGVINMATLAFVGVALVHGLLLNTVFKVGHLAADVFLRFLWSIVWFWAVIRQRDPPERPQLEDPKEQERRDLIPWTVGTGLVCLLIIGVQVRSGHSPLLDL
jgi:hypothetical protein